MTVRLRHGQLRPAGSRPRNEPYSTLRDASPKTTGSPLTIAVGRSLGMVTVAVRGGLGDEDAKRLDAVLTQVLDDTDHLDVMVDVRRVTHASAAGLAVLVAAAAQAAAGGTCLRIGEPSPSFEAQLVDAGLGYAIDVVGSDPAPTWVTSLRVS